MMEKRKMTEETEAQWRRLSEEILSGMTEWRQAHPKDSSINNGRKERCDMWFDLILFGFPTHIITRKSLGNPLEGA
jgi:hypothetical protein